MTRTSFQFRSWVLFIGAVALMSSRVLPAREPKEVRQSAVAVAVEKVTPALVFIQEPQKKDEEAEKRPKVALGIIIDSKGIVVTNHSATKGMKSSEVVLNDGRRLPVMALLSDPELDLALIKIEDTKPLPVVAVDDSERVKDGDLVIALTAPEAAVVNEALTIAVGLISGKVPGTKKGEFLFRVDTAVGPGVSSGPLVTTEGKFVGLIVSRDLSTRFNCAVPSNWVKEHAADWTKEK